MELALIYTLEPTKPENMDKDDPITYTCGECGQSIMAYNTQSHAENFHHTELFVLKNYIPSSVIEAQNVEETLGNV